jgi:hypothetical protein
MAPTDGFQDDTLTDLAIIGGVQETYRPDRTNLGAGVISAIVLIVGGLCMAYAWAARENPQPIEDTKYMANGMLGILALIAGLVLLTWVRRLFSHKVLLAEHGIAFFHRGRMDLTVWNQILEIHEILTHESVKLINLPFTSIKSINRSLLIKRKDGKEFQFTLKSIKGIGRLTRQLRGISERHAISWLIIEH